MIKKPDPAVQLFDFADQLAIISYEVLRYRIKNRDRLSQAERTQLEDLEIELDGKTAEVRAKAIAALGNLNDNAKTEVETASKNAEAFLKRIRNVKRAISIITAVLNLSTAVISGKPFQIASAVGGITESIETT